MATGGIAELQQPGAAAADGPTPIGGRAARRQAAAGAAGGRRPGTAAAVGTRPATRSWRRWQSSMIRDFEAMERDQQGYIDHQRAVRDHQHARPAARPQEPGALLRRARDSAGGAAAVPRRHRCGEPRQRQHLHHGRRRAARRERAGEDPRQVNAAGGARRAAATRRTAAAADPLTKALEKNEDVLRSDPHDGLGHAGAGHRRPALQQHEQPAPGRSSGSTAISATTTCSATRRRNDTLRRPFRTIEVKVKRPGVTVAARKGYFAVRDTGGVADQRLGSAGARRARAEAGAQRVSRPRRRAAVPRARPSRAGAGGRRGQDRAADVPAGRRTARATPRISPCSCASSTGRTRSSAR